MRWQNFASAIADKSRAYRSVGLPVLNSDGSVVAFAASNDDGWRVVRDCKEGPRFDWVGNMVVSLDGKRLAETREAERLKSFVVVSGNPGPSFNRVTPPVISDDGRRFAYVVDDGSHRRLVSPSGMG